MADRPNIVYILADDLGYGDVSCLNPDSKIQTPNMDRVAAEGLTFTDAHSGSAVCTPTRYGIMTGRYCWRSRLKKGVLFGYSEPLIEQGRTTVASLLHHYGYTTACIGKWHLGLGWHKRAEGQEDVDFSVPLTSGPHTLGFDHSYIIPASLDMAPYCYIEDGRVVELPTAQCQDSPRPAYYRGGACAPGFQHETTLLELTMRAEGFINRHVRERPDDPFFLYFPTSSPHTPHVARAPFRGQSQAGPYGDFVVEHDWSIGRILNTLDRHGLSDNTLVYVTSDNGCHSGPPRLWEDYQHRANYHFRGQKSDAWDGGHRIPLLVRWPGQVKAGAVCEQTVCLTDLLHTSAAMCDHQLAGNEGEDSYNLLPYLRGDTSRTIREATVHHSINGDFAIRQGPWKLVLCRGSGGWSLPAKDVPAEAPEVQLYDMANDVVEQHNVQAEHPEGVERLTALVRKYQAEPRSAPVG